MGPLLATINAFRNTHPILFTILVIPVVTAAINIAIWYFTSDKWDAFLAKRPRLAAFYKILAAAGFNIPSVLKWVLVAITGKLPTPIKPVDVPVVISEPSKDN